MLREDEQGLGIGVLVGCATIIFAIIVVAGVGIFLLLSGGEGGTSSGLATYPGAQEVTGMSPEDAMMVSGGEVPEGWSGKVYTTSDPVNTVASWYRDQMGGWTNVMDTTMDLSQLGMGMEGIVVMLAYSKGDDGVVIMITDAVPEYDTLISVASGPASGLEVIS